MRTQVRQPRTKKVSSVGSCADPEGGGAGGPDRPPPLKNHKNICFLSNTGPDPLKSHKATKQAFNIGPRSARQRNAIKIVSLVGR